MRRPAMRTACFGKAVKTTRRSKKSPQALGHRTPPRYTV
jgi:hypothetical protein